MKLKEATKRLDQMLDDYADEHDGKVLLFDLDAVNAIKAHAESTRWRKLSEEKPEDLQPDDNGEWPLYQCFVPSHPGNMRYCQCEWRPRRDVKNGPVYWGFVYEVTHWRPNVGPEEYK